MSNGGPRTLLPAPLLTFIGALLGLFLLLVGIHSGVGNDAAEADGDSSRIAFTSDRDGNQEIYLMNADGSGLIRCTTNPLQDRYPFLVS